MSNFVTETVQESIFSRIKNAIFGVIAGIVLIPVSVCLIFWNEYRTITETHRLEKAESICVSDVPVDQVDQQLEGKLVHVQGTVHSNELLTDKLFGIDFTGLTLSRKVEFYQWVEEKETKSRKKFGGGKERNTKYSYKKKWTSSPIDSSDFKQPEGHTNPDPSFQEESAFAMTPSLGAFEFPNRLIPSLRGGKSIPLKKDDIQKISSDYDKSQFAFAGGAIYFSASGEPNPSEPKIGDQKIRFQGIQDRDITLISGQTGETFRPSPLGNGYSPYEQLADGKISSIQMFQSARDANTMWKWGLRIGGFVLMWIGFGLIMNPLAVLADVIPFIGSIIGWGTWMVAFLLAAIVSLVSFAVAWFAVRPILSGGILLIAGAIVFAFFYFRSSPKAPGEEFGVELVN